MLAATAFAQELPPWRTATPAEQRLDAAAFEGFDEGITTALGDVQSVVVILQGRKVYEYYRDGHPDTLRDAQSVTKSALALLVGTALQRGQLDSLDQPVVHLIPEWRSLNPDPRSQAITLSHLLAMTSGFETNDSAGTAEPLAPAVAWARPIRAEPGERFAYDNSGPALVQSILERITGHRIADLVHAQLVVPLALREPRYVHHSAWMRTVDMAKLGCLLLQDGRWANQQVLPPGFVAEMVRPHSTGGPPVGLPYGLYWWAATGPTYIASGYGGQVIWVHPPLNLVVAVTSTVSQDSWQRGQAMLLARGRIFQAVQKRLGGKGR
ncbi:beta-lactamase family protein [Acidovorax sp. Be4]|uniref:Beta-lactamase family protein n=1 Tax=Acidovorax bellezanensis TaxID=2976702 RepID=A0ABT2PK67_9BURK|nr:serine hydrolase [Acidovorax sp. Be4]MCT9810868.1 beta-lactamase family protein [Acidovorax sp. Be4]